MIAGDEAGEIVARHSHARRVLQAGVRRSVSSTP